MMTAAIITPTTGGKHLSQCVESVQNQTHKAIVHMIVADGPQFRDAVEQQLKCIPAGEIPVHLQVLPFNTGAGKFRGYRICTAFGYLLNADVVLYLDDDNWLDSRHVEECLLTIEEYSVDWAFSLRRIARQDGSFLIDDDCDSIGYWRRDSSYRGHDLLSEEFIEYYAACPFLVDTSCFAIKRETLFDVGHMLLGRDSFFATHLIRSRAGGCTGMRSVNYRLRSQREGAAFDYFSRGNESCRLRYGGELPWRIKRRCKAVMNRSFLDAFPTTEII